MHVPECIKKQPAEWVYKNIQYIALWSLPFNWKAKYIHTLPVQFHTELIGELITYLHQNFKFSERETV